METIVPYSAFMFDAYGGSWIYIEKPGGEGKDHPFERRRVEPGAVVEEGVVVRPGSAADEKVVVDGAASIYSREFYRPPAAAPTPH
jgi:hypothetical protein